MFSNYNFSFAVNTIAAMVNVFVEFKVKYTKEVLRYKRDLPPVQMQMSVKSNSKNFRGEKNCGLKTTSVLQGLLED